MEISEENTPLSGTFLFPLAPFSMAVKRSFLRLRFSAFKWSFSSREKTKQLPWWQGMLFQKDNGCLNLDKIGSRGDYRITMIEIWLELAAEILSVKDYSMNILAQESACYKVVHVFFVTIPASLWRETLVGFPFVTFEIVLFLGLPKRQHTIYHSVKIVCKMTQW